jgi:hypothetical protein
MRIFKPQDRVSVVKRYWQIRCSHRLVRLTPSRISGRLEGGIVWCAWTLGKHVRRPWSCRCSWGRPEILRAPPRDGKDVGLNMADRPQVQDRWRLESSGAGPMAGRTDGGGRRVSPGFGAYVSSAVLQQSVPWYSGSVAMEMASPRARRQRRDAVGVSLCLVNRWSTPYFLPCAESWQKVKLAGCGDM